jgi:hypothetical protein
VGPKGGRRHHVDQEFEPEGELVIWEPQVVGGVLLRREGVHLAAHGIDRLRDGAGRSVRGALEQQLFEEV